VSRRYTDSHDLRMASRLVIAALVVVAIGAGAFLAGRSSAPERKEPRGGYAAGYRAGREDAFSGFDGGWAYGTPYIVTLRRGPPGITYRFARRRPMLRGRAYRVGGHGVCSR